VGVGLGVALGVVFLAVALTGEPPRIEALTLWALRRFAPILGGGGVRPLIGFVLLFAVNLTAVAAHEIGHMLAGLAVGFRFNLLRIGRIEIHRGFRLTYYRGTGAGSGGWVGGWAQVLPLKTANLHWRALVLVAGGPAASLLAGLAALAIPFPRGLYSGFFCAVFAVYSLILGVVNLIPFRSQAVLSDGMRLLMLLRNGERGVRWLALMKLIADVAEGVPAEALPADFVAQATAVQDDSPDTVAAYAFAYSVAYWQHRDEEAAHALETCLRYSSFAAPLAREALMSDAGVFQARRRRRIDLAVQWRADLPAKSEVPWLGLRIEAAIREAQGDSAGALAKLGEWEKLLLEDRNEVRRKVSLRGLQRWQAELQAAVGARAAEAAGS